MMRLLKPHSKRKFLHFEFHIIFSPLQCDQIFIQRFKVLPSVTRFGETSPIWQYLKVFGKIFYWFWYLANICTYLGIFMLLGIDLNGHRVNNNIAIWSHWSSPKATRVTEKHVNLISVTRRLDYWF